MVRCLARMVCLIACLALGAAGMLAGEAWANAGQPWAQGDAVGPWRVRDCQVHPEFVRCIFDNGAAVAGVEYVAAGPAQADRSWCSAHYRLQPAPQSNPPPELLVLLRDRLRQWDQGEGAPALADQASKSGWNWDNCVFALLDLLISVAAVWLARRWLSLAAAAWLLAGGAGAVAVHVWLAGDALPVGWITSLHESTTRQNIELLYGRNRHAGPHLDFLVWLTMHGDQPSLRDLVRLNLAATLFSFGALAAIADAALGRLAGVVMFLAMLGCPLVQLAAISELESPVTGLLALAAVPALARLAGEPRSALALSQLMLATLAMGLVRTESAGWGLCALAWHAARARWGADAWAVVAARARLWAGGHRWQAAALLAVMAAAVPLVDTTTRPGWLAAGLHPLHPSILTLPLLLLSAWPLWLAVPGMAGAYVLARRHWSAWGWILLATVILYRVWFAASHRVYYEMVRYCLGLLPLVAAAALLALAHVDLWLKDLSRRAAILVGVTSIAVAVAPSFGPLANLIWDRRAGALDEIPLLDRDQQREVRALQAAVDGHPRCILVAPLHLAEERLGAALQPGFALFGGTLRAPIVQAGGYPAAAAAVAKLAPPCAMVYRGLDCALIADIGCTAWPMPAVGASLPPRASRLYADPREYGPWQQSVMLSVSNFDPPKAP